MFHYFTLYKESGIVKKLEVRNYLTNVELGAKFYGRQSLLSI